MKQLFLNFLTRKVFARLDEAAGQPGVTLETLSTEASRRIAEQLLGK